MTGTRFSSLEDWLSWQAQLHPQAIDLGLERVSVVLDALHINIGGTPVITVAGTNGKGSCVAFLESIFIQAGFATAAYTSPHLTCYNERIRISAQPVSDKALCEAFAHIDAARGDTTITYFEFGTLAALWLFAQHKPDVLVLETGLGGRLDAVNVIDADVAIVTSIAMDHCEWLGNDLDSIGREKAGIARPGRPVVIGDPSPPQGLLQAVRSCGARAILYGHEFVHKTDDDQWCWQGCAHSISNIPLPNLSGEHQIRNAACALAAIELLAQRLPVSDDEIRCGIVGVSLPGRFQVIQQPVTVILDVAHNPAAASVLASLLAAHPCNGRTFAVFAAQPNKDIHGIIEALRSEFDGWFCAPLASCEHSGHTADRVQTIRQLTQSNVIDVKSVGDAYRQAQNTAKPGDRIVVFGSFLTVSEVMPAAVV